ncbi:MAG: hemerythrin family protein [Betaproteobacteria bacterium]|nr:hemerythrin family protein [Betaproteobacteria bacterium]
MRVHDYPERDEHAEEHRQLLAYMEKLRNRSIGNEDSLSMMVFIQQWLREHIRTGDRRYAAYLANAGIKTTA